MAPAASDLRATPKPKGWHGKLPWVLLALSLLAAGAWLGWRELSAPDVLPLTKVRLAGPVEHVPEAELRAAISRHLNAGMLGLDVAAIREALVALPWVRDASVRREWPGTLVIDLQEHQALARWGETALVSQASVVFEPTTIDAGALPQLSGPPGTEQQVVARFQRLRELFAALDLAVTSLHLDARHAWSLQLAGGATVRLDADLEHESATRRFLTALAKVEARGELKNVDLRYPNGFALAWEAPAGAGRKD